MFEPHADAAREAARLYRSTGALPGTLLRPEIQRAWERSHTLHADPRRVRPEALDARAGAQRIAHEAPLVAAAAPYLRALSQASGRHLHAAVLGDARAVVLAVVGDPESVSEQPAPGALFDEASAGANGVGTPLAEGDYVEIVGPEHFAEALHAMTCQGIPLRDGTGSVVGVLATSVRRPEVSLRLREMLRCAAHGIEAELLHASLEARLAEVLAAPDPARGVLERLHRDLLSKYVSARTRVELASEQLGRGLTVSAGDVLALALRALSAYRREAAFWRALASPAEAQPSGAVPLDEAVRDLAVLLDGEAAALDCEIQLREIAPATVRADAVSLRSALLGSFLSALAQGRGGAVLVDVRRERAQGVVSLSPQPGPAVRRGAPAPFTLRAPLH
jgi:sigma-54 dependent transcriptional regulator, acetoin dehydrogenase operon transcriptional activator AcoR